jgi:DNA modification methylase
MPGQNSRILGRHVFQTWKPWVTFSNGAWPSGSIGWHEDTTPASVLEKSYRWQQDSAPAAYLIESLTQVGDMICDPFVGVGSYGEAVVGLEREFIGCEADSGRFAKAVERLRSQDA